MAKRTYYRTTALLGAQPRYLGGQSQRRRVEPLRVPWPLVLAVGVVLLALLWLWLDPSWYVDASHLEVSGASPDTAYVVAEASEALSLHGLWLRPDAMAARVLKTVPSVTHVDVVCWVYPAQCSIQVAERQPVLIWQSDSGSEWVDAVGVRFPVREARPGLPVVQGPLPEEGAMPAIIEGVNALAALGVNSDGLGYNPRYGLVWTDPEGRRIAFGTGPEMEPRWQIYQALLAQLDARGVFPLVVDVRFPGAPTYALERLW